MNIQLGNKKIGYQAIPGLVQNKKHSKRRLSIEEIADGVSIKEEISVSTMKLKSRKREIVQTRQLVMYISTIIVKPNYTTKQAAAFFGLNHATAIHGRRNISDLINSNRDFQYRVMQILEFLNL